MNRRVCPLSPENSDECTAFLLACEHRCVSLVSNILEDGKPIFEKKKSSLFIVLSRTAADGTRVIDGVIYLSPGGTLLHLLSDAVEATQYTRSLRYWLKGRRIHCIMGTMEGNLILEKVMLQQSYRTLDYDLMVLTKPPQAAAGVLPQLPEPHPLAHKKPSIRKASLRDANLLLPLQLGYEKEEVLAPGNTPNTARTLTALRLALSQQQIYAGFYGDQVVAKAGTNARGVNWDQLGGIYTDTNYRALGIASALVAHVVRKQTKEGKKICLFVKNNNLYAKKAYARVGFEPDSAFRIAYY